MAHGPSCSAARGIFPDQGSNPCLLHWQADSQPLRHQGSPDFFFFLVSEYTGEDISLEVFFFLFLFFFFLQILFILYSR